MNRYSCLILSFSSLYVFVYSLLSASIFAQTTFVDYRPAPVGSSSPQADDESFNDRLFNSSSASLLRYAPATDLSASPVKPESLHDNKSSGFLYTAYEKGENRWEDISQEGNPVQLTERGYAGSTYLNVSFPYYSWLRYHTGDLGVMRGRGWIGIALGLEHYYSDKAFIGMGYTGIQNFPLIMPGIIHYHPGITYNLLTLRTANLTHHHRFGRFTIGYGLSAGWNTVTIANVLSFGKKDRNLRYNSVGIMFPVYYNLHKAFRLGLLYRPAIYHWGEDRGFRYESSLSIDIGIRIRLSKR